MSARQHGFAFVLHAHLPFVLNHGRWPHGADWLNEAAAETYIPLLIMMRRLTGDGVRFRLNSMLRRARWAPTFNDFIFTLAPIRLPGALMDMSPPSLDRRDRARRPHPNHIPISFAAAWASATTRFSSPTTMHESMVAIMSL